jgi:hypothetical protein
MKRRRVIAQAVSLGAVMLAGRGGSKVAAVAPVSGPAACGVATGRPAQRYLTAAKRMPRMPDRSMISADELDAYDQMKARVDSFAKRGTRMIDGQPYGVAHMSALGFSPKIGIKISGKDGLNRVTDNQDKPGSFTSAEHEIVDMVLPLDSGYYGLLVFHTAGGLSDHLNVQTIEALRDHRDDLIHPDDELRVQFVRAVRDGRMTDEIWTRMQEKLGSERGVVDLLHFILLMEYHQKYIWACGVPEMSRADFGKMLEDLKANPPKPRST